MKHIVRCCSKPIDVSHLLSNQGRGRIHALFPLIQWVWITQICASEQAIISADNGSSSGWCKAIIWASAGSWLIVILETNLSEILINIEKKSGIQFPRLMSLIARLMGSTWGPPGADRTQVGPTLAPWSLLSGTQFWKPSSSLWIGCRGDGV